MNKTAPEIDQILYFAFLRGINVGGNKLVKMGGLKKAFESLGFKNVGTFAASGNVSFAAPPEEPAILAQKIEEHLKRKLGSEIGVIVRAADDLRRMAAAEPFGTAKGSPDVKLYVTFLTEKCQGGMRIPSQPPDGSSRILKVSGSEIFSLVDLSKGGRSVDLMGMIEKKFGGKVTTRDWNTIKKMLKAD